MSQRAIKAGNAYVEVGIRNRLAKGASAVQADLRKLGRKLQQQGQSMMQAGLLAGTAAAGLLAGPVKAASEMQETMGKFNTVFGGASKSVQAWSEATAASMGTSRQEMAAMLSGMQDLLVPMGVMPESAEGMSKELSKLAVDLGSFNNLETDQVMGDLMAAMTGSGEVMKKYGVILSEAAVKQELVNQGIDPKKADDAAKAQARLNIIMRGTTAAQGDAIRTAGSFANQVKRMKAAVVDTAAAIGGPLLDDLASFASIASSGITAFRDFAAENSGLMRAAGLALVAVAGLGVALVAIGGTLSIVGVAFAGLAGTVGLLLSPVTLAVGGIAALGIALVKYTDLGSNAVDWLMNRFGPLVDAIKSAGGAIMEAIQMGDMAAAWEIAVTAMELVWLDMTDEIRDAWSDVVNWVLDIGSDMAAGLGSLFQGLSDTLRTMLAAYEGYYNTVYDSVISLGGKVSGVKTIGGTGNAFESSFGGVKDSLGASFDQIDSFGRKMQDSAVARKQARNDAAEAAKIERDARLKALRESLDSSVTKVNVKAAATAAAEEAKATVGKDSAGDLAKVKKDVEKGKGDLSKTQDTLDAEQGRTGPAGTFSAFAAGILGSGNNAAQEMDRRKVSALEQIAKNTKENRARFA